MKIKKLTFIAVFALFMLLLTSCEIEDGRIKFPIPTDQDVCDTCDIDCSQCEFDIDECPICEACEVCEICEEPFDYQTVLMTTRTLIRRTNIGIVMTLFEYDEEDTLKTKATAKGSGVLYRMDDIYYYALTNYHVIDGLDADSVTYEITSYGNDLFMAEVVTHAADLDLAVIRFPKNGINLPLIDLNTRTEPLVRFELLLAVGSPSGVPHVVTYGEYRNMTTISNVDYQVIFHSALIWPGNSGGALTDINGYLVGLNTWSGSSSNESNYAIPLPVIHDFLDEHDSR